MTDWDINQERIGYMTIAGWDQLLNQVNRQIEELEKLPLPEVKDQIFSLLEGIDAIHREALSRLVSLFKEGVLEQVIADPPIHTLMELYDLLPPDVVNREQQQFDNNGFPVIPVKVIPTKNKTPASKPVIPHWVPVPEADEPLVPNTTRLINIDGHSILLCRVEDEYFALTPSCDQDGSSLAEATIEQYTLICPNHEGCYYDIRQGTRIAASGSINCFPVEVAENDKDHVMIGIGMKFSPNLPAM